MPTLLEKFARYLQKYKNYSPKTVKAYCDDLLIFFNFLKFKMNLEISVQDINIFILQKVHEKDIYSFMAYLNYYRNNTSATRERRLKALKRFYKWLYQYYPSFSNKPNPIINIQTTPNVVRLPKYLDFDKAKIIQNIFTEDNCKDPKRNNAVISMFLHAGIRISELANLSIKDIDFSNKKAFIIAKGKKERTIFLDNFVVKRLKEYLDTRTDNCEALFISSRKKRISTDAVDDICKKAFKLLNISDTAKYSAHTLRHTAATLIYKQTNDLLITKEFLGHSSISSTEIYSHVVNDDVKDAVSKNPLANYIC